MVHVDSDHRGPLVNVAGLITALVAGALTIVKIFTKWRLSSRVFLDDGIIALAFLSALGCTVATGVQVSSGLGQHQSSVSSDDLERFEKALLTSDVFYIAAIFSAKLALVDFLRQFARPGRRNVAITVFLGLGSAWVFIALFVLVFRCPLPDMWMVQGDHCVDLNAFWIVNAILDILGAVFITGLPMALLYDVQLPPTKRWHAILTYVVVLVNIPIEVLRIVSIWQAQPRPDLTWDSFTPSMYTVIRANCAVIISCLTFLIPVLQALSVGTISSEINIIPRTLNLHPSIVRRGHLAPFDPLSAFRPEATSNSTRITSSNWSRTTTSTRLGRAIGRGKRVSFPRTTEAPLARNSSREPIIIEATTTVEVRSDPGPNNMHTRASSEVSGMDHAKS